MTFRELSQVVWSVPLLIVVSGFGGKPECDSFETRSAVLRRVSDDHNNALASYAARTSSAARSDANDAKADAEKALNSERAKPLYQLGEKIVTRSASSDKRTLTCSGSMSVTVGDTKASKEVNFTVQQASHGKISVSVAPFQFQAP
ncbi:MAG TPA: hypothetical protein VKY22_25465 [Bradyrhizobium sp.]|nr:hypothetical protein [Bradyrhizobium sp.]